MEAIAYVRWSTEDQKRGDSEARQSGLAANFCADKKWVLRETHIESGKSAFHGRHRVGSGKMLALERRAARGELAGMAVLVESLDRMSREEPLEGLNLLTSFTKMGVTIVETLSGEMWTSEKIASHWTNLLTAFIRAGLSYEESKKKSGRITSAWRKTQETLRTNDGKCDGRISPSWIEVVDGEYQVIESRAAVVRQMFQWSSEGVSLKGIKSRLDAAGTKKWTRGDRGWVLTSIGTMLRSRAALGEYLPQSFHGGSVRRQIGEWKPAFPAIITETLWAQAQAALSSRKSNPGLVKGTFTNVLSGVAHCGTCGGKMVLLGTTGKDRKPEPRRLQCGVYRLGQGCTSNATFVLSTSRDFILDYIGNLLLDSGSRDPSREPLQDAQAELEAMQTRIDNLVDTLSRNPSQAIERSVIALEAKMQHQQALIRRLSKTFAEEQAILPGPEATEAINRLRGQLETSEEARRHLNRLLRQYVDRVSFFPEGVESGMESYDEVSQRRIFVTMLEGKIGFLFNTHGRELASYDMRYVFATDNPRDDGLRAAIISMEADPAIARAALADILRRSDPRDLARPADADVPDEVPY